MLFDIGWPELLLIGAIALVVIGPKDLPRALRVAGFWVRKARTMSREFQSSVEQMIHEAELDDVRKDLQKATEFDFEHEIRNTVDPENSLVASLKPADIPDYFDPTLPGLEVMPATAAEASPAAARAGIVVAPGEEVPEPPIDLLIEPELPFADELPPRLPEPIKP